MAGQINIAGTSASIQLQGSDSIVQDTVFTFPNTGGQLLVSGGNVGLWNYNSGTNTLTPTNADASVNIGEGDIDAATIDLYRQTTTPSAPLISARSNVGSTGNYSTQILADGRILTVGDVRIGGTSVGDTPTITLTSEGEATFAGGNINFAANGDGQFLGRLKIGGTDADPKVFLNESAGSASFAGNVKTGNGLVGVGDPGAQINAGGMIASSRVESSTQDAFYVQVAPDSSTQKTKVIHFQTDGSATFEGNVSANDTLDVTNSTTNANSFVQRWFSDIGGTGTQKAILLANGQLTLAGDGNQGAYVSAPTTASGGYKAYYAKSASAGVDTQYFLYGDDAGDVNTVRIATDGSADFYGEVTAQGRTLAETQSGTWTPTCNAGTLSFVAARCYWIRTGNLVVLNGSLSNFTNVSDGSEIVLSGYPYAAAQESYGSAFLSRAAAGTGSNVQVNACYVLSAGDGGGIKFIGSALDRGGGAWGLRYNNLSSTQEAYFQVSYMTDNTTWVPSV